MNTRTFLKCSLVAASVILTAAFSTVAQAQNAGGGGGGRGMGGMGVLTQDQRTKMRDAIQGDLQPLMEKLAAAEKEVVKAALDDNANDATIKTKLEAVQKLQTEVAMLRLKGVKAIASSLTSDQKSQLENARDGGYMALFGMMGGRGGGGGGRRNNNNNN